LCGVDGEDDEDGEDDVCLWITQVLML